MKASIVIPTFNRRKELMRVLELLQCQTMVDLASVEVIVVDDGSTDDTWHCLGRKLSAGARFRGDTNGDTNGDIDGDTSGDAGAGGWAPRQRDISPTGPRLRLIRQENAGPARARNRGVEAARGDLILFLGDDTLPRPDWLAHHLEEHRAHGLSDDLAVLGYTSFPAEHDSAFRRFINEGGAQFGYSLIERPRDVAYNFFYTSNISLPRRILVELGGFREDFPAAAWEDIELAYRAVGRGLRLVYQPRARVVHHHPISPAMFCRRQRTSGASAAIFARLHPELSGFLGVDRLPRLSRSRRLDGVRQTLLGLAVGLGEVMPGLISDRLRQSMLDLAYLRGLAAAMAKREPGGSLL